MGQHERAKGMGRRADKGKHKDKEATMDKALLVMLVCAFGFGAAAAGGHGTLAFWLFLGACSGLMVYTEKAAEEKAKRKE
jgi:hypothetical protein